MTASNNMNANDFQSDSVPSGQPTPPPHALHSIRTRYALVTAVFLLVSFALFYTVGRITLVNLVRNAEEQVRLLDYDVRTLAYRHADLIRRHAASAVADYAGAEREGSPSDLDALVASRPEFGFAIRFRADGAFAEGRARTEGSATRSVSPDDFAPYANTIFHWISDLSLDRVREHVGVLVFANASHYATIVRYAGREEDGYILVGAPFDDAVFTGIVGRSLRGIHVSASPPAGAVPSSPDDVPRPASMLDRTTTRHAGGIWCFKDTPFQSTFNVRDINGAPLLAVTVSLPKPFNSVIRGELNRLTVLVAVGCMLIVLPLFLLQSRLLLDPLTRMAASIRLVCRRHNDMDCPRVEWRGKDEFAQLAESVNELLESLSRRALAVAQSESRQRALIDGLPDGLAVFDLNRRALVTVTKQPDGVEPIPGLAVGAGADPLVFGNGGAQALDTALAFVAKSGNIQNLRLTANQNSRRPRHLEVRITRLDERFALATFRDITAEATEHAQRLAAESRLHQAQKQESLTALAAGIAHDANNILAVILNTAEATWSNARSAVERSSLDTIRDAVRHGSSMARELMTFAGETQFSLAKFDPTDLVKEAQRLSKGLLSTHRNITLSYDLPPDLPAVDADPNQIWKVFFNLAKNASEAIGERPGEISISTRKFRLTEDNIEEFASAAPLKVGTEGVLFMVSDTGSGIPAELRRRIFDPYVSTKSSGRGLGLATVFAVVSAHNGGIRLASEIGEGTTFGIFLPASRNDGEVARQLRVLNRSGNVLIVDDDQAILRSTSIVLKTLNVTSHTARTRAEALASFRNHLHSLTCVLLDANLDGVDAVQLVGAFRALNPHVPIVVSSGTAPEKLREQFAAHPYDDLLSKPYTLTELQDTLARVSMKAE